MKKKIIITSLSLLTFALIMMSSNSGMTSSTSGCSCHGYPTASTVITMTGVPTTGYVPGTAYTITLSATNLNYAAIATAKAGFDLIFSAGSLSNAPAQTTINGLEISHSSGKAMTSGTVSWTFTWTAPASGTGAVTANIALNVTNGNGNTSGDAYNILTVNLLQAAPASAAPTISNVTSSAITTSAATISANVNANNATTTVSVEYGLTMAYGSTIATSPSSATGSTATAVSANLTSLTPNTTYNYRIKAVNSVGTTYSANSTFTTAIATALPSISNVIASAITTNSATISGDVIANNAATTVSVEYGLTIAYGSNLATTPSNVNGSTATSVSANLTSLTPNTTYNYRIKAVNSVGTTYSANSTFTTAIATALPTISNVIANAITTNSATINGDVIANNATTSVSVEYGLTTAYGSTLATTPSSVIGSTVTSVSANLTSLTPNTTYNYRIKAVNSVGTTYSVNNTFQTNSTTSIILLEDNGFIVSPNPSSDGKFVLSKQHQKEISNIEIYNALGSKIALSELSLQNFVFDLSSYASGIYYLSFYVNGRKTIAKLIKN
jgi:HKD family nuclease